MEIGLLAICSLIGVDITTKSRNKTQIIKYFIVQALRSLLIIIALTWNRGGVTSTIFLFALLIKIGGWPFIGWYIRVIQHRERNIIRLVLIITWQKILPTYLLYVNLSTTPARVWVSLTILRLVIPLGLLKPNLSLKKTIALSSVRNNSWFIILTLSIPMFILFLSVYIISLFLLFYTFRKREKTKETKEEGAILTLIIVINMGGIPPFPIFWVKLFSLSVIIRYSIPEFIIITLLTSSCIFIYFYIKNTVLSLLREKILRQINRWLITKSKESLVKILSIIIISLRIRTIFIIFL